MSRKNSHVNKVKRSEKRDECKGENYKQLSKFDQSALEVQRKDQLAAFMLGLFGVVKQKRKGFR